MAEITQLEVKNFLLPFEGQKITLNEIRNEFNIVQGTKSYNAIRVIAHRLCEERVLKAMGARGEFRVLQNLEPVQWWVGNEQEPLNFTFPQSYEDYTRFGWEDILEVYAGDLILIGGVSNFGKTALALSILGENLALMPCFLMGGEYTASNGKISPKFQRRMRRMKWADWLKDDKPRFQLYPVGTDYEDYVVPDSLNIIDWISLPGEYYMIDSVMKSIKDRIGHGVAVVVLQKNRTSEWGEGGERSERYGDVCMTIDPYGTDSMVTMGKVKAQKGRCTGRMWAFEIVDHGANLLNIHEIVRCKNCWGTGKKQGARCDACDGKKYVAK